MLCKLVALLILLRMCVTDATLYGSETSAPEQMLYRYLQKILYHNEITTRSALRASQVFLRVPESNEAGAQGQRLSGTRLVTQRKLAR